MAQTIPILKDLANLSHPAFVNLIKRQGNYKERSQATFANEHKPELEALNRTLPTKHETVTGSAASTPIEEKKGKDKDTQEEYSSTMNRSPPRTLLIGDSLLERLKTPLNPPFQPISLGLSAIEDLKKFPPSSAQFQLTTLPSSINLGCSGDKIENVLYRLYAGTYRLLLPFSPFIKLIIIQVGTNNLRPLRPLTAIECAKYGLLLAALLKIAPDATLVCSGLFNRADIPDGVVGASNDALKKVVEGLNNSAGVEHWTGRVKWVDAPVVRDTERVDHVHLNKEGYRLWDRALDGVIAEVLRS